MFAREDRQRLKEGGRGQRLPAAADHRRTTSSGSGRGKGGQGRVVTARAAWLLPRQGDARAYCDAMYF
jgi:hypothetical protein